jgi:hypothetical protein
MMKFSGMKAEGTRVEATLWMTMLDALNQAIALFNDGRQAQAEPIIRRVLQKKPTDPRACALMGQICDLRRQYEQSDHFYQRGLKASPESSFLWMALGQSLLARGKRKESLEAHRKAFDLGHPLAALGLCEVLTTLDHFEEAVKFGRMGYSTAGDRIEAYQTLAGALSMHGRLLESLEVLGRGVEAVPGSPVLRSAWLTTMLYDPKQTGASIRAHHEEHGRVLAELFPEDPTPFRNRREPERALKVGILSSDFRKHAVASFVGAWLGNHDRERYPVHCYHTGPADVRSEEFAGQASVWNHTINMPDDKLVAKIRADGIDVLVELNGHSPGTRVATLLARAAPVQATYLGYAATTGLPTVDYRIVDWKTDPAGYEAYASERLARLERCFVTFAPPADAPPVKPLAGLKPGAPLTIGSFSTLFKVSPEWLDFWGRMIESHPGWRLVFKNQSFRDPGTAEAVRKIIVADRAIADRVELWPATQSFREHMDLYNELDIVLDVRPYAGTTTTCDALWMGAPTVTYPGGPHEGHHARVGESLMQAVGLEEFIAKDEADFVRIIERFDADRPRLAAIRAGLRERMAASDLGNGATLARAIEGAIRQMWRAWCDGSGPGGKRA